MQVHMVSILIRPPQADWEDHISYRRRRLRLARNMCSQIGMWSETWAKRVISWHEHNMRAPSVLRDLVLYRDANWLQSQRWHYVVASGAAAIRNTIFAGRTGTRANIGRPQMRWEAGIALARSFLEGRRISVCGKNSLSVGSRIRNAAILLAEAFNRPP